MPSSREPGIHTCTRAALYPYLPSVPTTKTYFLTTKPIKRATNPKIQPLPPPYVSLSKMVYIYIYIYISVVSEVTDNLPLSLPNFAAPSHIKYTLVPGRHYIPTYHKKRATNPKILPPPYVSLSKMVYIYIYILVSCPNLLISWRWVCQILLLRHTQNTDLCMYGIIYTISTQKIKTWSSWKQQFDHKTIIIAKGQQTPRA